LPALKEFQDILKKDELRLLMARYFIHNHKFDGEIRSKMELLEIVNEELKNQGFEPVSYAYLLKYV
jgi:hypothetical protein